MIIPLMIIGLAFLSSCKDDDPPEPDPSGKLRLNFIHQIDGEPLIKDQLVYTNEAGNPFMVTEVQYFISDVTLHRSGKDDIIINKWKDMHYVDNDIPSTMSWEIYDALSPGEYDSVSFNFGIASEKNATLMFLNPPERDMFWPVYLGGGYHYLKINGKWERPDNYVASFDFHLGIGQIYASDVIVVDSIIAFVDNSTRVGLPSSSFAITDGGITDLDIIMNIENWFRTPNVLDFNVIGAYTMQNQGTMAMIKENASDVFSVPTNKKQLR